MYVTGPHTQIQTLWNPSLKPTGKHQKQPRLTNMIFVLEFNYMIFRMQTKLLDFENQNGYIHKMKTYDKDVELNILEIFSVI